MDSKFLLFVMGVGSLKDIDEQIKTMQKSLISMIDIELYHQYN
jgi:hypothetical protein